MPSKESHKAILGGLNPVPIRSSLRIVPPPLVVSLDTIFGSFVSCDLSNDVLCKLLDWCLVLYIMVLKPWLRRWSFRPFLFSFDLFCLDFSVLCCSLRIHIHSLFPQWRCLEKPVCYLSSLRISTNIGISLTNTSFDENVFNIFTWSTRNSPYTPCVRIIDWLWSIVLHHLRIPCMLLLSQSPFF